MFWADAAAAAAAGGPDSASGDDIWLLASAMLARGELHRAAHTVTSRGLHRYTFTIFTCMSLLFHKSVRVSTRECDDLKVAELQNF